MAHLKQYVSHICNGRCIKLIGAHTALLSNFNLLDDKKNEAMPLLQVRKPLQSGRRMMARWSAFEMQRVRLPLRREKVETLLSMVNMDDNETESS
jgi:hypothetical protein